MKQNQILGYFGDWITAYSLNIHSDISQTNLDMEPFVTRIQRVKVL